MLTEVSGDGGQCLPPVKWGRGRRQPITRAGGLDTPPRVSGPEELRGSYKCPQSRSCADSTRVPPPPAPVPRLSQLPLARRPWRWAPACCRCLPTHRSLPGVPLHSALWQRCPSALLPVAVPLRSARGPHFAGSRAQPLLARSASRVCRSARPLFHSLLLRGVDLFP